ncbi:MAG: hypothetical protein AAFQ63_02970, partial [Cyanobacteria bacterium J06621_11]
ILDKKISTPGVTGAHVLFALASNYSYKDYVVVVKRISLLVDLLEKAIEETKSIKNVRNSAQYIRPLNELRNIFKRGLINQDWSAIRDFVNDEAKMAMIDVCGDMVAIHLPQKKISVQELEGFLKDTEDLLSEVSKSDMEEDIKSFLLARLEEITIAIRRYNISGSDYLRRVVEANIGGVLLKSAQLQPKQSNSAAFLKKLFKLALTIGGVLDLGANVEGFLLPKGIEAIEKILPPGE